MALSNVALTDTFDIWRTRTNQLVVQSNFYEVNLPNYTYANNIGVGANTYANLVGQGANSYMIAVQNGSNTAIGAGANAYANLVGAAANAYMIAVQNGSNTAVGAGANAYTNTFAVAVGQGANAYATAAVATEAALARSATNLTSGTVPSARITGVGTITTGVWNGTAIAVGYGGTGGNDQATARSGLGLVIGTNVQAWDANLDQIAALAPTDNNFIVGNGSAWTLETPSSARTSLGLGTMATQDSSSVSISGGSITVTGGSISGLTSLAVSGAITATGDITAFSSDARLKGDIQTITDALSKVNLITGITYKHNDLAKSFGYTDENRFAGVLAQEVEVVLPEVVVPAPFDVADDGTSKSGENYKTVKYEKIVPLLIEAIKELTAKVEMLELKVGK